MKPKKSNPGDINVLSAMDVCQTPPYALEPLMQYIDGESLWDRTGPNPPIIWEPANGQGILSNALKVADFDIVTSDIQTGQNFFEYDPDNWDVLITNPPFSIKPAWLRRCYELCKPFALLMPVEFMGTAGAAKLFAEYGVEIMILTPRVDFKMPKEGWFSSAQFPVCWYCWNLLPKPLMFAELNKPQRDIWKWKTDKKGNKVKQWGYGDWVEKPISFDWTKNRFIYKA